MDSHLATLTTAPTTRVTDGGTADTTAVAGDILTTAMDILTTDHTGAGITTGTTMATTTATITATAITVMEKWITGAITVIPAIQVPVREIPKVPPLWIPGKGVVQETLLPQRTLPVTMLRPGIAGPELHQQSAEPGPPPPGPTLPGAM